MPDVEPLRFPSSEGRPSQQDQADLQDACSGRRRTCALLNSPSLHVNSAICHMQELKATVEDWCQQYGKYQPHINQDKHQHSKTLRFQSRDSDTESVTSTELIVEGVAISARESCPLSPLLKKINDVLGEVVYLIERLEADRQYAEEALHKENRRRRLLESKVDGLSLWKQQEHSSVVQKEREACARAVAELKRQLKLEREKLDQAQERLSHTEVLNQRLHEDIGFAKKQVPVVKDNLDLQRATINQINTAQAEANEAYSKTQSDLMKVQQELKKMEVDGSHEKASLDHVLLAMNDQLANRLGDLNQLQMLEKGICAEINDAEETVARTKEMCAAITQHIPEMAKLEKSGKTQIVQLKQQIDAQMQKNKKLKEKQIALQEDFERAKLNGEAEVSCVEEQLRSKRNAFAALRQENMECEQNVADCKIKISESEKAVKRMCAERKQMLQKMVDNEERWETAKDEATQVVAQHSVTRTRLEEQEQLTFVEEQRARGEIEILRNSLKGQVTAAELLKGQCQNISEELKEQRKSSELTNQKLQQEFEAASSATQALEKKVKKMKNMTEEYERIQCEHRGALLNLEREKTLRREQLRAAQDLYTATVKRYDSTLGRISDLAKKSKESRDASARMEETAKSVPDVIAELQSELDVAGFKNKSAALVMSTLQSDINNCQQRTQRSMQRHTAHVTARKREMEDAQEALKVALEENKRLAREYEGLQKILVEARQEEVSALSSKNHQHKAFHYYTQLSLLQKRMHKALVKYFKQRSLYSRAELDRCQALSQETDQKIKTAQEGLSGEIHLISAFLQSLTDDSTTTDDAGASKQASPDAAGSNE